MTQPMLPDQTIERIDLEARLAEQVKEADFLRAAASNASCFLADVLEVEPDFFGDDTEQVKHFMNLIHENVGAYLDRDRPGRASVVPTGNETP